MRNCCIYNVVKSKVEILLSLLFVFILFSFATIGNEFSTTRNFLSICKIHFVGKLSTWLKIILKTSKITSDRGVVLTFLEAAMNLQRTGILCIFGTSILREKFCLAQLV